METLHNIDISIFLFFNVWLTHPILDSVMTRITHFGFWVTPGLLTAGLYVWLTPNRKKALIVLGLMLLTVAVADPVSSQILKKLFARARPCHPELFVEGGRFLLGMKTSLSFPSSHAMNMFSIATLFTCFYPKRWMYFMAYALLIGYTRVYCGVHYPFDIFGGMIFGAAVGGGIYITYDRTFLHRKSNPKNVNERGIR